MRVGSATPAAYRLGSTAVDAIYLGATSIWPPMIDEVPVFTVQPSADSEQVEPNTQVTFTGGTASVGAVTVNYVRLNGSDITLTNGSYTSAVEGEITYQEKAVNGTQTVFSDEISVLVNAVPEISAVSLNTGVSPAQLEFTTTEFGEVWYIINGNATPLAGSAIRDLVVAGTPVIFGTASVAESSPVFSLPSLATLGAGTFYLHVTVEDGLGGFSTDQVVTVVLAAPTLSASSPADDATDIAVDAALVLATSEDVLAGTGSFSIREGGVEVEAVAIASCTIDNTANTITIPHANWSNSATVSVRWPAGIVTDIHGLGVAANAGDTLVNFTTAAAASAPTVAGVDTPGWSATDINVTWPVGHAIGDHLYVFGSTRGSTTITPPGTPDVVADYSTDPNSDDARIYIWRYTAASAAEPVIAFTGVWNVALIHSILVKDGGAPTASAGVKVDNATTISPPGGTTTSPDTLIFHVVVTREDTGVTQVTNIANTDLTDVTERLAAWTAGNGGTGLAVYSGIKATAGVYGAATVTFVAQQTQWSAAITVEVPPA